MKRDARLYDIVQELRDGRLHTAAELATRLGVSTRTIWRDMEMLATSGLPVTGATGSKIVAPGMLASHYAPGKPVRLGAEDFADEEFGIGFGDLSGDYNLSAAGDLTEAAARLFDALHAGAASAKTRIAVAAIPGEGLGAAINDRLARAAV